MSKFPWPHSLLGPTSRCRSSSELETALLSGGISLLPLPASHPSAIASGGVHLSWLAALAPHLISAITRVCLQHGSGGDAEYAVAGPQLPSHSLLPDAQACLPRPEPPIAAAGRSSSIGLRPLAPSYSLPPSSAEAEVPEQLSVSWRALTAALGFCQRSSRVAARQQQAAAPPPSSRTERGAALRSEGGETPPPLLTSEPPYSSLPHPSGAAADSWLGLLDVFIDRLRNLRQEQQHGEGGSSVAEVMRAGPLSPLTALRHIYAVVVEEIVGRMAEQLPLAQVSVGCFVHNKDRNNGCAHTFPRKILRRCVAVVQVVQHLAQRYATSTFGEFRSTLLGLFSACAYERNIISAANRLANTLRPSLDAFLTRAQGFQIKPCWQIKSNMAALASTVFF